MKKFALGLIAGLLMSATMGMILATANGVFAKQPEQEILHNKVKLEINGEKVKSGTLSYNGTTYIQLRDTAELLGVIVDWNGDTNVANLITKSESKLNQKREQTNLFEVENAKIETISLKATEMQSGQEEDINVDIGNNNSVNVKIARDNPNGLKVLMVYKNFGYNLLDYTGYGNLTSGDYDEAVEGQICQVAFYDFDKDGIKEVIVATGNKKDDLNINILKMDTKMNVDNDLEYFKIVGTMSGSTIAYVDETSKICVVENDSVEKYDYNKLASKK